MTRRRGGAGRRSAVRRGTSEELVTEALDRIAEVDGEVNAFTVVLADEAPRPRAPSTRRTSDGGAPLAGVPVSVKDHIWLAAHPATNGSAPSRDFVPTVDAGRSPGSRRPARWSSARPTTRSSATAATPTTTCSGLTRNPWSLDRTPGGSSGGAGASVAYGATPIALGTDGGGSIRIPAAFCGVVGHKPTFGLVPKMPGFRGWPTLSVDGPLTRTVRDAALALSVMAGPSAGGPADLAGRRAAAEPPPAELDWSSLRVAVSEDLGWAPVEPVGAGGLPGGRGRAGRATAPRSSRPPRTRRTRWSCGTTSRCPEGFASEGPLLGPMGRPAAAGSREIVEAGRAATARDYLDAQERRRDVHRPLGAFFEYDVLLAPVHAAAGVRHRRRVARGDRRGARSTRSSTTGACSPCPRTWPACRRARCRRAVPRRAARRDAGHRAALVGRTRAVRGRGL